MQTAVYYVRNRKKNPRNKEKKMKENQAKNIQPPTPVEICPGEAFFAPVAWVVDVVVVVAVAPLPHFKQ